MNIHIIVPIFYILATALKLYDPHGSLCVKRSLINSHASFVFIVVQKVSGLSSTKRKDSRAPKNAKNASPLGDRIQDPVERPLFVVQQAEPQRSVGSSSTKRQLASLQYNL